MKKYIVMESLPNLTEGGGHKFAVGAIFISNPTDGESCHTRVGNSHYKSIRKD